MLHAARQPRSWLIFDVGQKIMIPDDSDESFRDFARARGCGLDVSIPARGLELMLEFYEMVRSESRLARERGDMLLYQWGVFDWSQGYGPSFQVNITRQFIEVEDDDDQGLMGQLMLTYHYRPHRGEVLGTGTKWCETTDQIETLRSYIGSSAPYVALKDVFADRVEVEFTPV